MTSSQADLRLARPAAAAAALRAALILLAALAMTWPAWINGGPLLFFDSPGYVIQGRTAFEGTLAALRRTEPSSAELSPVAPAETAPGSEAPPPAETAEGGQTAGAFAVAAASTEFIRSVGYSGFAFLASATPLGSFGIVLGQALLLAAVLTVLAGRDLVTRPAASLAAAAFLLLLTPLPWFVSYLMPDILASVPILIGIILVRRERRLGLLPSLFLLGGGTFACLSHYGHLPLAVVVGIAALLILGFQRRLTLAAVLLALAPTGLASAINAVGSAVAFEEASVAPKRLPILLARSIADGPARWHLEENCPDADYAICDLFGHGIPSDLQVLLWSDSGLLKTATPQLAERIRDEEILIISRAFLDYPFRQVGSVTGNALHQLALVGTGDFTWGGLVEHPESGRPVRQDDGRSGLDALAYLHIASTAAGLCTILLFLLRDGLTAGRREREMLLVLLVSLPANAAIFGGLSAPVDRYSSRIVWLLPLLAALFWLARRPPAPAPGPAQRW